MVSLILSYRYGVVCCGGVTYFASSKKLDTYIFLPLCICFLLLCVVVLFFPPFYIFVRTSYFLHDKRPVKMQVLFNEKPRDMQDHFEADTVLGVSVTLS